MESNSNIVNYCNCICFKLKDEYNKEEYQTDKISAQFNSTNISFSFYQFLKYSQYFHETYSYRSIMNELIEKLQEIEKNYKLNEKSIEKFFKLIEDEEVTICNDEYFDLYKLSELLKVNSLQNFLQKYAKEHSEDIDFLITLILKQQSSNELDDFLKNDILCINVEEILRDNIDKCLLNEKFGNLPISIIYRILDVNKEKPISSDLLYEFINKSIEKRYTLFNFIQFQTLSDEKFDSLFNNYLKWKETNNYQYYQYLPIDLNYFKSLKYEKKSLENQIQLQNELFKKEITKYDSRIKKLEQDNDDLHAKIGIISSDFKKAQSSIAEKEIQIKKLEKDKNDIQDHINKITINFEEKEVNMKNNFLAEKQIMKKNIDQLEAEIDKIEKEKNDYKSQIKVLNTQIKELKQINEKFQKKDINILNSNNVKIINFKKERELNGILRYLTVKTGGNIHDKGTIKIESNSIFDDDPDCHPKNLVDYENDNFYQSDGEPGAFILFDFKEKLVQLNSYTIKNGKSIGHYYLKNWVIEVSNDGEQWDVIDTHINDDILNNAFACVTFDVQIKNLGFYRFIRIRQTGQSWCQIGRHFCFWFPFIEFYGDLRLSIPEL